MPQNLRRITLSDLARALGVEGAGDLSIAVVRAAHPAEAGPEDLAVAASPSYAEALKGGGARAALLWPGADWRALGLEAALFAPRPRYAMAALTQTFQHPPHAPEGVHPSAVVDPSASIGPGASIGPFVWIGPGARIGARARILAHASVGADARIGDDALLHAGVRVGERVRIGDRFIAQPNAVIGGDGFSFVTPEKGAVESARQTGAVAADALNTHHARIHSLGAVRIGDDVEIGAGSTVDRGTLTDTRIGSGTKIDNLVQIGHNVEIGENCLLCAQVGVAGSARIGDRAVLGGKVGVADHVRVGHDAVVAASSGVGSNVPPRAVVIGSPAIARDEWMRMMMAMRRLPRLIGRLGK
ncbi:UDP-3-O-(3-hydroxymyristoyl)glucosamine N-acyltransferase [Oceanicella actignis]|uniref:UDP-3-O-acylglucosamine N-acyltransferase n=1 Tax=Oceanicella actignis TaxID=1189325 RepID=A0A1M7THE7_9RHOB|nr:UDP-3-O-(3-hydroxymyristoyl)glucosamine N-acyltransferase [Oceanicella actignis]TYO88459.1 UDP-3-O-[3-hydroxymyristoyl] glucosamine N-acyltransferase [Oceanicella actignis]SET58993.1 UDP-3-O-[3-hydroxymyristoyl] glucosamine N-acyltransferase [Oceanicella actignis]SHN70135.1 UDP-3-O-[3-hydroxymyristoyl] glucosamine N-acyltransferase [Oceanicella actignis]